MNFFEMMSLIEERGEKIHSDKTHLIYTNAHLYMRSPEGDWVEKELPPVIEKFAPIIIPPKENK